MRSTDIRVPEMAQIKRCSTWVLLATGDPRVIRPGQGIIRYSYSSLGCKDDSWIDATDAFCRDLEGLIRCREY